MTTNTQGEQILVTDPGRIKLVANEHFRTIPGSPPAHRITLSQMTPTWFSAYSPNNSIDPNIYSNLLAPPSNDEWRSTIASLPNGKAAGPSGISYEMIKYLTTFSSDYLLNLITECFDTGCIPSQWKDASIYPIPKPTEWNCSLKNTRPICLLETARKLMTKILTNRLASILHQNNVLKGNNYAGLPGGSCHTPVHILESILHDSNVNKKPVFIFLQDISKAFDSIDTNMLQLALQRLRIPSLFIKLILSLFVNRSNRVITAHGLSDPYKVQIGIDQGEVISPLLWVIYIDPLLTVLNASNSSPYQISSPDNILSHSTASLPSTSLSTLAFMDDTTLISSSINGLTNMLNLANEFYAMNNTKINFSKAELITNRDPLSNSTISSSPSPYTFILSSNSFSITPIAPSSSFRFLGVWFSLMNNTAYVKR